MKHCYSPLFKVVCETVEMVSISKMAHINPRLKSGAIGKTPSVQLFQQFLSIQSLFHTTIYYRILLLCFALLPHHLEAKPAPVPLIGTELHLLHSDIVHQDFELYVKLPWSYEKSDTTTYPVLFTTDGNRTFPIYSTTSLVYETPGFGNPEIIIVGIGYKVNKDRNIGLAEWADLRNRDLRPERDIKSEQYWHKMLSRLLGREYPVAESGHAAEFLQCIKEEIIPYIESHYRVSTTDRGIAGYSLGGRFTIYALFNASDTFNRFFAGDPWANHFLNDEAQYAANHDDLNAKLLITATQSDESIKVFVDSLQSRNYPGLELHTRIFKKETHVSGGPGAISHALQVLYYAK